MLSGQCLVIANPGIGGSGYLTVATMEADAAIAAGYHASMHICRGLAQAGGPLCVDVVIETEEVFGAESPGVDYINSSDLTEGWRLLTSPRDFQAAFPRGVTLVSDYHVEVPILVAASRTGPRFYSREQFLQKFQELIEQGQNLRVVCYNFSRFKFPAILKGPFSIGVMVADLEERQEEGLLKISKEDAVKGIIRNVPAKGGVLALKQRQQFNTHVFNCGYELRKSFTGPTDQRLILLE
ncbi:MAG: hypothetical protein JRI59_11210 [Deltaproteobacteria bacterium]|nr:hypothetical protein [Deltaproteobacteria bacterium]